MTEFQKLMALWDKDEGRELRPIRWTCSKCRLMAVSVPPHEHPCLKSVRHGGYWVKEYQNRETGEWATPRGITPLPPQEIKLQELTREQREHEALVAEQVKARKARGSKSRSCWGKELEAA